VGRPAGGCRGRFRRLRPHRCVDEHLCAVGGAAPKLQVLPPNDGHLPPVGSSPGIGRLAVSLFRAHHTLRAMTFQVGHILLPTDS